MSEFHVALSRDAFERYTQYLVRRLSEPIRDFFEVVVRSVVEEYEAEHKGQRRPGRAETRELFVRYCREFALLNTDQITKTVKVLLKGVHNVGALHSIIRVLFRNVAEVYSSVVTGDPGRMNVSVDLPSVDRFMHKWLSLLCRRLVRYPHLVYRDGVPEVDQLKYDREWDRLVLETLEGAISELVGVEDIVREVERSESAPLQPSEPVAEATGAGIGAGTGTGASAASAASAAAAEAARPGAMGVREEKELEALLGDSEPGSPASLTSPTSPTAPAGPAKVPVAAPVPAPAISGDESESSGSESSESSGFSDVELVSATGARHTAAPSGPSGPSGHSGPSGPSVRLDSRTFEEARTASVAPERHGGHGRHEKHGKHGRHGKGAKGGRHGHDARR